MASSGAAESEVLAASVVATAAAAQAVAVSSAVPAPVVGEVAAPPPLKLLDLPQPLIEAVFVHLFRMARQREWWEPRSEYYRSGPFGPPARVGFDVLVRRRAWATVALAGRVCRRFRSAFLNTILGVEAHFDERLRPMDTGSEAAAKAAMTQTFVERGTALAGVLPKLGRLRSFELSFVKASPSRRRSTPPSDASDPPAEGVPGWVAPLLHRELFASVVRLPTLRALSWDSSAVTPAMLSLLAGTSLECLVVGGLHVSSRASAATEARAAVVRLLRGLAPTLRMLQLRQGLIKSVRLRGDRQLAEFLREVGPLPQLVRLKVQAATTKPDTVPGGWGAVSRPLLRFPFPLKVLDLSECSMTDVAGLAGLCRSCPLDELSLPVVPDASQMDLLVSAVGACHRSPRSVTFNGTSVRFAGVSLPLWKTALSETEEMTFSTWCGRKAPDDCDPWADAKAVLMALRFLPLQRLCLHEATLTASVMATVELPLLQSLTLVTPAFEAGAAAALFASLAVHSTALTHLAVEDWMGGLGCALYILRLLRSLTTLSLRCNAAFLLDEMEDESCADVADAVEDLRRARPKMRVTLDEDWFCDEDDESLSSDDWLWC